MSHTAEMANDVPCTLKSSCQRYPDENGAKWPVSFSLVPRDPTPDCLQVALRNGTDWLPGCCCRQGGQGPNAPFLLGVVSLVSELCVWQRPSPCHCLSCTYSADRRALSAVLLNWHFLSAVDSLKETCRKREFILPMLFILIIQRKWQFLYRSH